MCIRPPLVAARGTGFARAESTQVVQQIQVRPELPCAHDVVSLQMGVIFSCSATSRRYKPRMAIEKKASGEADCYRDTFSHGSAESFLDPKLPVADLQRVKLAEAQQAKIAPPRI